MYPTLAALAKEIYAIPASSSLVERVFSTSRNVVTDLRNRLSVEYVDSIVFLHGNNNDIWPPIAEVKKETSNISNAKKRKSNISIPIDIDIDE